MPTSSANTLVYSCRTLQARFRLGVRRIRRYRHDAVLGGATQHASTERLRLTRNIGIIAHIDAGKTTTTERMLYYSGYTRRIGDVDDGSTVTDFLPAERARGITIQSAAISFLWPRRREGATSELGQNVEAEQHTINLIDTPGHADFTFEVIRSLRVLDGAICILDGVAGVEAQTEKVWNQARNYRIPRIIYINKLDRDGAAFEKTVREVASRLHTSPALCQIPWWRDGRFIGIGDPIHLRGLSWQHGGDGSEFQTHTWASLQAAHPDFAAEVGHARTALLETLSEHDDKIVEAFLEADEDWLKISPFDIQESLRRCVLSDPQMITPVYAGASFRNIGVQPLLDAVNQLLPTPGEAPSPNITLGCVDSNLVQLMNGKIDFHVPSDVAASLKSTARKRSLANTSTNVTFVRNLSACALAFKVVNDIRRGVMVYVRVYAGSIAKNASLYNTNLSVSERAPRLLRMYASEAVEIDSIAEGQIGVITGLKYARTGDTLLVYSGSNAKNGPPAPINSLQLRPIAVPPPLFFTSVEPDSLVEEKSVAESLALLLREDPSLSVSIDPESGQTHLAGMGELHLEIARDRLINDFKVKATTGKIEIGYREAVTGPSANCTERFDREIAGKRAEASCTASVVPFAAEVQRQSEDDYSQSIGLPNSNMLVINHPTLHHNGKPVAGSPALPISLSLTDVVSAFRTGTTAALARGPTHAFPVHSTIIELTFDPSTHITSTSTPAALSSAARLAVRSALKASAAQSETILMEPVMLATITVPEDALGSVVQDLNAARGAHILSLDAEDDITAETNANTTERRLTDQQLARVYAPKDPFGGRSDGEGADRGGQQRQVRARVPLKEMVGYLKHLRSLTGGRGTFVMSVDRFERMGAQRMRTTLAEMRGAYG